MKMMAMIGFIMIAASGFAEVMKATGDVKTLVEASASWIGHSKGVGALLMLLVGLLVTMGIGSSFFHGADSRGDLRAVVRATGFQPVGDRLHRRDCRRLG